MVFLVFFSRGVIYWRAFSGRDIYIYTVYIYIYIYIYSTNIINKVIYYSNMVIYMYFIGIYTCIYVCYLYEL